MEYRKRTSEGEEMPAIDEEEHWDNGSSRDRTEGGHIQLKRTQTDNNVCVGKSTPVVENQTAVYEDRQRGDEATDGQDGE